ncbi:MAG TPA: thiol reductant ABC exporter subunit CydC [Steroidobacteraceae bacterium]|nr:thiol reductant ABC exporter subunit CydC [Steroidobacteraceae bacterium]
MSHWQVLGRLVSLMQPLRGVMAISTSARIAKLLMQTALVAYAAASIGRFADAPTAATLGIIAGMLLLYAFLFGLFSYVATYTEHYVAFTLLARLRVLFYDRLEPRAPAGTAALRTGDAVSRVINDCERIEPFYAHTIAPAIAAVVAPAVLLVVLARVYHPVYAWTLLPFFVLMVLVLPALTAVLGRHGGEVWRRAQGEVNAFLTESLQGIRDTIAFGAGERRRLVAWRLGEEMQAGQRALVRADAIQRGVAELAVGAAAVAALWVSRDLVETGAVDALHDLPPVLAIALTGFYATLGLNNVVSDYGVSIVSARRLFEIMDPPPVVTDLVTRSPGHVAPSIGFRNVTFGYSRDETVLRGITFEVPAGHHVAIVGSSGAGKSTLANLLLRFWDVDDGEVYIGGRDVRAFRLDDLRALIALVSQRSFIFNTTIGENIRLGKPAATDAEVAAAVRRANLQAWIGSLPDGLATCVGEMGSKISGGQRQRIAIARALLKDAPILILDEATSNLDVETEREVNAAILELARGRTVLTIAHRLSTVLNAEEIIVLDGGCIAERGTHRELLQRRGVYARVFELQRDEIG